MGPDRRSFTAARGLVAGYDKIDHRLRGINLAVSVTIQTVEADVRRCERQGIVTPGLIRCKGVIPSGVGVGCRQCDRHNTGRIAGLSMGDGGYSHESERVILVKLCN